MGETHKLKEIKIADLPNIDELEADAAKQARVTATIEMAQWAGRVLRARTGEAYEVVDRKGHEAIVAGVLVIPQHGYQPPTSKYRWGWRDDLESSAYRGDVVLRIDGHTDEDGKPTVEYCAGVLELADSWWRLGCLNEFSAEREAADLLGRIVKRIRYLETTHKKLPYDLETLQLALSTATRAWVGYRSELSGIKLALPIHLRAGKRLLVERRESVAYQLGISAALRDLIGEPVELELHL